MTHNPADLTRRSAVATLDAQLSPETGPPCEWEHHRGHAPNERASITVNVALPCGHAVDKPVLQVCTSGWWLLGRRVQPFECTVCGRVYDRDQVWTKVAADG